MLVSPMPPGATPRPARPGRRPTLGLVIAGSAVVLLALNLRLAISSLGVAIVPAQAELGLSTTTVGVLSSLPVVLFAVVGLLTGHLVRLAGPPALSVTLLATLAITLVVRATSTSAAMLIATTAVILTAIAIGNVLLPVLTMAYLPDRLDLMTSWYGAAVMAGASLGALEAGVVAGPGGHHWRLAIALPAIAAAAALAPWLTIGRLPGRVTSTRTTAPTWRSSASSGYAWLLVVCFGMVAAQSYAQLGWYATVLTEQGLTTAQAGVMLAVLTGVGIPTLLALPWLLRWLGDGPALPAALGTSVCLGWLGVLVAPTTVTWLWSVLIGFGAGGFGWILIMIGRHTRTPSAAAQLSSMTQGLGFGLAAIGPFGFGLLHDLTGTWTASLLLLIATGVVLTAAGVALARPWFLEDRRPGHPQQPPP